MGVLGGPHGLRRTGGGLRNEQRGLGGAACSQRTAALAAVRASKFGGVGVIFALPSGVFFPSAFQTDFDTAFQPDFQADFHSDFHPDSNPILVRFRSDSSPRGSGGIR